MPNPLPAHPSRRTFLARSSAASASLFALPFLRTTAKGATPPAIVGEGDFTYECDHGWGSLPEDHNFGGATHGVAFDSTGQLYVSHHGTHGSIYVFDPEGTFIRSLLPEHQKPDGGACGHGIDIRQEADGQEYLYLSPDHPSLAFTKATLEGEIIWSKDAARLAADSGLDLARYRPTNVSFGAEGDVFLGDGYGSNYIFHYSGAGEFIDAFGGAGDADGKFNTPHGQWLDARDGTPKTVIADRANRRLQWFDQKNQHLATLDGFLFPADIDVQGQIMMVPDLHARITLLDADNQVISHLGDDPAWRARVLDNAEQMRRSPAKWLPGRFVHPHDAAFDQAGNIVVAEWVVGGRLSRLRKVS
jgi:hypothetical protein